MFLIDAAYQNLARKRFPLPTESQIEQVEETIGVRLPQDFRMYLASFNGGYFSDAGISLTEPLVITDRIDFMSGIGASDESAELASPSDMAVFDDNFPAKILPIGYTVCGNMILLVTEEEGRGEVILKKAYEQTYVLLADGIEEFFSILEKRSPEAD
jgi:hypothetical protein